MKMTEFQKKCRYFLKVSSMTCDGILLRPTKLQQVFRNREGNWMVYGCDDKSLEPTSEPGVDDGGSVMWTNSMWVEVSQGFVENRFDGELYEEPLYETSPAPTHGVLNCMDIPIYFGSEAECKSFVKYSGSKKFTILQFKS